MDTPEFGKVLISDGEIVFSEADEFIYDEMVTHVPMAVHPNVKKVLIFGGGDGGVATCFSKYPEIECIDLVEPDVVADFDTAQSGDVVGVFWQPEEYGVNENFGFAMRRYFDEETNEWVNKALTVVDGKVLNPEGFVLIKKA
jgi:hypothetical protein